MKIAYVANIRLPTEKAHGIQVMNMCAALARQGNDVELIITDRGDNTEDPFLYYGVRTRFTVTKLHVPDTVRFGPPGFLFETWMFSRAVRAHLRGGAPELIYGRDERVLARLIEVAPLIWETHTGAWNSAARAAAAVAQRIVCITQGLKDFYIERGVPSEKLLVAHDGVDSDAFRAAESKDDARRRLELPRDKKIALYVGRLDGWKGSGTLLDAAGLLPDDLAVAVIGGEERQVAELSAKYPGVHFCGYRPYKELANNLVAADVLVLPNTGKDTVSVRFTSPLKLFAYMTSGVPIVASDLPSIREVVDDRSAVLVPPDNAVALAAGIREALGASARAAAARALVAGYSWDERARIAVTSLKDVLAQGEAVR